MTVIVRSVSESELSIEFQGRAAKTYQLAAALQRLHLLYESGVTVRYA